MWEPENDLACSTQLGESDVRGASPHTYLSPQGEVRGATNGVQVHTGMDKENLKQRSALLAEFSQRLVVYGAAD